ncbi:MAG TPA: ABC transporter permease [Candidatus Methylomirabilis sp.]|nr:ABC transporter permease [Candidatus Methylomirabilis sp.]HSB81046.1 ABC transporter permease [Candidatus Methylomirabilis sp.]
MRIAAIAFNTFREAIRDRILYSLLVFAMAMIGASVILSMLSVGGEARIIKDLGLAAIGLVGTLIAVFIGVGLVHKEIERRTLYTIITKPIRRADFVLGKFLGLALTLAVNVAIMGAGLILLASSEEARFTWELLLPLALTLLKLLLVTAIAVLFSTFSTPTLSAIFTLALVVVGSLADDLKLFAATFGGPLTQATVLILYLVLPNLASLDVGAAVVRGETVPAAIAWLAAAYGLAYVAALLASAVWIFQYRDFK